MFEMVQNCRNKYLYFSGVNIFWTVVNKEAMITMIKNMNKHGIYKDV